MRPAVLFYTIDFFINLFLLFCFHFTDFPAFDLFFDGCDKSAQVFLTLIAQETASHGHRAVRFLLSSDYQHIGKLIESCLTDFKTDFLGTVINRCVDAVFL